MMASIQQQPQKMLDSLMFTLTRRLIAIPAASPKLNQLFSHKSLTFVWIVMRVAVTTPVKEVTTLFVSGASSVNVPEK
jgi:hypothetical protein